MFKPLVKARKPAAKSDKESPKKKATTSKDSKTPDFSKQGKKETADPKYRPMIARGLPEPPRESDIIEFKHPKHGKTVRGRVTAVGEHGVTARRAGETSPVQVPHGNVTAVLPTEDYGQEAGVSPQDAQAAFLAPTAEGGMQATPLQVAILDVLSQFGFPIDDPTQVNYDQAKKLIAQYVAQDDGGEGSDDEQTAQDGSGASEGAQDEAKDGSDEQNAAAGSEEAEDSTGDGGVETGEDDVEDDPEVMAALERLVEALEVMSASNEDGPDSENDDKERGDNEDDKPSKGRTKTRAKKTTEKK